MNTGPRRIIGALSLLLAALGSANAQIAFVQTIGTRAATATGTTLSVTVPAAGVAAGDTVILSFTMPDAGPGIGAADSRGNVYAVDTITVTYPSAPVAALSASEFSGVAGLDQTQVGTGTNTAPTTAVTAPTTSPNELLIGAIGTDGPATDTFTAGTGYVALASAGT